MYQVGRRLTQGLVSLLLLFTLVFVMLRAVPGDPARLMAGPTASERDIALIRDRLGLDQPIWVQYGTYLVGLAGGDLGSSIRSKRAVTTEIASHLPLTVQLVLAGMVLATALGLAAGVLAAVRRNTLFDLVTTSVAVAVTAVPSFWLALILIDLAAIQAKWLPPSGAGTLRHLILPAVVIASTQVGLIARLTRGALIDVLGADYVRTARSKGLPERTVYWTHAMRNAWVPVVTVVGLQFGVLIGGTVITETIFNWPGVGRLLIQAVLHRDYPMIQGLVLLFGVVFIVINLAVDGLNIALDPRVRRGA